MLVTHRQCMTPAAAGNTNPVTLISYSFVGLGPNCKWKDLYDELNEPHEGGDKMGTLL